MAYRRVNANRKMHHSIVFKSYALDTQLTQKPGLSKAELLSATKNLILAESQLKGKYKR